MLNKLSHQLIYKLPTFSSAEPEGLSHFNGRIFSSGTLHAMMESEEDSEFRKSPEAKRDVYGDWKYDCAIGLAKLFTTMAEYNRIVFSRTLKKGEN